MSKFQVGDLVKVKEDTAEDWDNMMELYDIARSDTVNATIKLMAIKEKASTALKPETTEAPPPAEDVTGKSGSLEDRPFISGATFE